MSAVTWTTEDAGTISSSANGLRNVALHIAVGFGLIAAAAAAQAGLLLAVLMATSIIQF